MYSKRFFTVMLIVFVLVMPLTGMPVLANEGDFSAEEFEISDEVRAIIVDFLVQFPTIFSDYMVPATGSGWGAANEDEYVIGWDAENRWHIVTTETPSLFLVNDWTERENEGFFDRYGNRLNSKPWMMHGTLYATNFSLWNFDHSGIPMILVSYWGNYFGSGDGGTPAVLFRYIDGEFKRVLNDRSILWRHRTEDWQEEWLSNVWFPWQSYYADDYGNLIAYFFGIVDSFPTFAEITFENDLAIADVIAFANEYWESGSTWYVWDNFRSHHFGFIYPAIVSWFGDNTHIPGCNTNLTPINPLTRLHDDIFTEVRDILHADGTLPFAEMPPPPERIDYEEEDEYTEYIDDNRYEDELYAEENEYTAADFAGDETNSEDNTDEPEFNYDYDDITSITQAVENVEENSIPRAVLFILVALSGTAIIGIILRKFLK